MSRRPTKKQQFSSEGVEIPEDVISEPGLYHHPDPLLRRLRLEDPSGLPIGNLKTYFRDVKAIVFYFGSVFGEQALREFHRDLAAIAAKDRKELAVVYVSADSKYAEMTSILQGKPWLRMTFHDGSDFAPMAKSAPAEVTELLRGEDFVLEHELGEYEIPAEGKVDPMEYDYVRPLSRAALAAHVGALKTPTVSVYHLPTHKFLDRYVRPERLSSRNGSAVGKLVRQWKSGRSAGLGGARDIFDSMKWTLILALLVGLYKILVYFGGSEYDLIPQLMARFSGKGEYLSGLIPDRAGAATTTTAAVMPPILAGATTVLASTTGHPTMGVTAV